MVRCPFTHQVYQLMHETKQRETAGCAYNTGSGNTQTLVGTDQSLGSTDDKVKHASEQTSKQTNQTNELAIVPGVGFGAPSLAKHFATRSMVRCPFAHQVCTTMQTNTRNAVQSLNQLPLTNGFTNCKRQANLRGHTHSSNFYSSSMSAQR